MPDRWSAYLSSLMCLPLGVGILVPPSEVRAPGCFFGMGSESRTQKAPAIRALQRPVFPVGNQRGGLEHHAGEQNFVGGADDEEVRKAERSSLNASEWTDNIQGLDGSCRSLRTLCPRAPPHHFAVYSLNRTF